ncbi:hypothetical protein [Priestia endophytica]|jgi:uncharacterized phage infection (PIP) family protein YhgE|uniref:hypothetical protein n=2 Tax=Priestia endophytica TaxID=135735 RepID=UPI000F52C431|nr:hypothetical protein [Priestia endophytica]RPK12968.1 hypothetical protein FH5_03174 [Priestia endophytica]
MVPREMLPLFYEKISAVLPATYVAEGLFTIAFGGSNIFSDISALMIILFLFYFLPFFASAFLVLKKLILERNRKQLFRNSTQQYSFV